MTDIYARFTEEFTSLQETGIDIRCSCGKWMTYIGYYDEDGKTLRCHGCLRSMCKCTCGRI